MISSDLLLERMSHPDFYPHLTDHLIQKLQTHISYIFLTGEYAYKLKKPLDLGFLDFSTLEKRKYYCQQELNLNQPIAPDIYLDVLPITQQNNDIQLNGEGQVVDYVLKMRQFPQSALLSVMQKEGQLSESLIIALGKRVATFHQQTKTNDYISQFGQPEAIAEAINNNYQQTEKYIGITQTEKQFQETKAFTDNFLDSQKSLFQGRVDQGFVRECHGDLHLKNICWWQDKIQLFDRIEFNEPFRFVDVMYDVAFTVMDLQFRGCPDFANVFLNCYLEQTGDWEGIQVLPLYLSRQAYVRAKVNSLMLDDPHISEEEKQHAREQASQYYHLAWDYTQSQKGRLWMMSGLSGSGKTTIARKMAKQQPAIHLRSDAVRKHLAGIDVEETGSEDIYTPEMSEKTYDRLLALGILLGSQGWSVILDAKYDRQDLRQAVISEANQHHLPLQIVYCDAPMAVLRDRVAKRSGDISDATPDLLAKQKANAEPFTATEQAYIVTLDTSQPWENLAPKLFSNQ
ncbi:MAG: AAA family ATPase [Halothece sp. Uz-M2-17]|nr:AAA family ATPase [Halothece sp. Uz-M2-17]